MHQQVGENNSLVSRVIFCVVLHTIQFWYHLQEMFPSCIRLGHHKPTTCMYKVLVLVMGMPAEKTVQQIQHKRVHVRSVDNV